MTSPRISSQDFLKTAAENNGEVLATAGGQATFKLRVTQKGVCFTPLSTGKPRNLKPEYIEPYIERFNQTGSTTTSDYSEHRNPSYVLAIIKLWLGQRMKVPPPDDGKSDGNLDAEFSAPEGEIKVRSHRYRERSRELVEMAKAVFRNEHSNRLFCEVCDFDFGRSYGEPDFIEVHHVIPLRDLKPGSATKLSDLKMVCANCHRMLHRGNPWPTIAELQATRTLAAQRSKKL
jgi:hypothetical protein